MQVTIIGPGRLGRSLEVILTGAGHRVELVRDRPPAHEIVLITVPDAAIASVATGLHPGHIVLHTSGTTPFEVLRPHRPAGSWHPLMTFPGPELGVPDLAGVPAAIAGDPEAIEVAMALTDSLGMRPLTVPGDRRLYHAAAVVAGNFATVLLGEASRILAAAGVDPDQAPGLLAPLALQSLRNAAERGPARTLTGPVARGDTSTLQGHRDALADAGLDDLIPLHELLSAHAKTLVDS